MAVNPETTVRKLVSMPHELVARIQEYRYKNRIASEAEAIRRLVEKGLASE